MYKHSKKMTSFTPSFGTLLDVLRPNINLDQGRHRMHDKGELRQEKTERRCQQATRQAPGQPVWPGAGQRSLEESPVETAAHTVWVPAWMVGGGIENLMKTKQNMKTRAKQSCSGSTPALGALLGSAMNRSDIATMTKTRFTDS